jgi:hypothetical protein
MKKLTIYFSIGEIRAAILDFRINAAQLYWPGRPSNDQSDDLIRNRLDSDSHVTMRAIAHFLGIAMSRPELCQRLCRHYELRCDL